MWKDQRRIASDLTYWPDRDDRLELASIPNKADIMQDLPRRTKSGRLRKPRIPLDLIFPRFPS